MGQKNIRNCSPGQVANVETLNPACDCPPGIANISESQDGLKMIITLTDGTSYTLPLPPGRVGPKGDTGATGPVDACLIWSDATDSTTATISSFTPIKTGSTDFTNPSKNLVNVGDQLNIHALAYINSANTNAASDCRVYMNGNPLSLNFTNEGLNYQGSGLVSMAEWDLSITLTDNTAGAMKVRIAATLKNYIWVSGTQWFYHDAGNIQLDLSALNFNSQNNTFTFEVNQAVASTTICSEWSGEIIKQIQ